MTTDALGRRHRRGGAVRRPLPAAGAARPCCWCVTSRPPRRSCRTRSSRCTAAGGRCGSRRRGWRTCGRPSSTGPARCCGTAGCRRSTSRRSRATSPGADEDALVAERRREVLDAMRAAARPAARGARAALLPRPLRGGDRLDPRHQPRRREEPCVARRRRPALPAWRTCHETPTDDQVRALLDDAVSDVEPRRSLERDPVPDHRVAAVPPAPWVWGAGGAVLATAATIAGRRGPGRQPRYDGRGTRHDSGDAAAPDRRRRPPSGRAESTVTAYYVGDTSPGPRLFPETYPVEA